MAKLTIKASDLEDDAVDTGLIIKAADIAPTPQNESIFREGVRKRFADPRFKNMHGSTPFAADMEAKLDQTVAGIGGGLVGAGIGAKQIVAEGLNKIGLVSDDTVNSLRQRGAEHKTTMTALKNDLGQKPGMTNPGSVGEFIGENVPLAGAGELAGVGRVIKPIWGASRPVIQGIKNAAVGAGFGGAFGLTEPLSPKESRATAVGHGTVGGAVGGVIIPEAAKLAGKGIKAGVNALGRQLFPQEVLDKTIANYFREGIKPSVGGQKNIAAITDYDAKAVDAVKTIVENKNNLVLSDKEGRAIVTGEVPTNLWQASEAVAQTKQGLFTQFDDMMRQADAQGGYVDLTPVVAKLEVLRSSPALQDFHPESVRALDGIITRLQQRGKYSLSETQEIIKDLNRSLLSFYEHRDYASASRAGVDEEIVRLLRQQQNEAVTALQGEGYQALRNKYGALSAVEDDIAHRTATDLKKSSKGLIDFSDIYNAGKLVTSLKDPGSTANVLASYAVKSWYKRLNDPNNVVKKMFKFADKHHTPKVPGAISGEVLPPEAEPFNSHVNPKLQSGAIDAEFSPVTPGGNTLVSGQPTLPPHGNPELGPQGPQGALPSPAQPMPPGVNRVGGAIPQGPGPLPMPRSKPRTGNGRFSRLKDNRGTVGKDINAPEVIKTPEEYTKEAEVLGVKFAGMQDLGGGKSIPLFQDEKGVGSFVIQPGEVSVSEALSRAKARYNVADHFTKTLKDQRGAVGSDISGIKDRVKVKDLKDEPTEPFYSAIEQVVNKKMGGRMDSTQLMKMLEGSQGVTKAELEDVLADLPKGIVTKQQVLDTINGNKWQLTDEVLGEGKPAQFSGYQTPGGKKDSYRELFVTADKTSGFPRASNQELDAAVNLLNENGILLQDGGGFIGSTTGTPIDMARIVQRWPKNVADAAILLKRAYTKNNSGWKDGHGNYANIKNPIVRVRFNERTGPNNERILHVEEMQGPSDANQEKMPENLRKRIYDIGTKRVLAYAKANGFDEVAWTPGEVQKQRYHLTKVADELHYDPTTKEFVAKQHGRVVKTETVEPKQLKEWVGESVADKLVNGEPYSPPPTITPKVNDAIDDWARKNDLPEAAREAFRELVHKNPLAYKGILLGDAFDTRLSLAELQELQSGMGTAATKRVLKGTDLKETVDLGGLGLKDTYDKRLPAVFKKYGKEDVALNKNITGKPMGINTIGQDRYVTEIDDMVLGHGFTQEEALQNARLAVREHELEVFADDFGHEFNPADARDERRLLANIERTLNGPDINTRRLTPEQIVELEGEDVIPGLTQPNEPTALAQGNVQIPEDFIDQTLPEAIREVIPPYTPETRYYAEDTEAGVLMGVGGSPVQVAQNARASLRQRYRNSFEDHIQYINEQLAPEYAIPDNTPYDVNNALHNEVIENLVSDYMANIIAIQDRLTPAGAAFAGVYADAAKKTGAGLVAHSTKVTDKTPSSFPLYEGLTSVPQMVLDEVARYGVIKTALKYGIPPAVLTMALYKKKHDQK